MSWFKTKIKLTEEDKKIQEVVSAMLRNQNTLIEIDPSNMSYLLSNEEKQYFIDVDSVGIKISNHKFFRELHLESNKIDIIKKLISTEASKRRAEKREVIFKNGVDLLDNIINNLYEPNI